MRKDADYMREYMRKYRKENKKFKEHEKQYKENYDIVNQLRRKARSAVQQALENGTLVKQPCKVCGTTRSVVAHHNDYSKPLEVDWLCASDHKKWHAKHNREMNSTPLIPGYERTYTK